MGTSGNNGDRYLEREMPGTTNHADRPSADHRNSNTSPNEIIRRLKAKLRDRSPDLDDEQTRAELDLHSFPTRRSSDLSLRTSLFT